MEILLLEKEVEKMVSEFHQNMVEKDLSDEEIICEYKELQQEIRRLAILKVYENLREHAKELFGRDVFGEEENEE